MNGTSSFAFVNFCGILPQPLCYDRLFPTFNSLCMVVMRTHTVNADINWFLIPWLHIDMSIQRMLPKICPFHFLHTTFRQKWGGGVCSNIQFISCIRPLPPFLTVLNKLKFDNHDNCCGFLNEQQLRWSVSLTLILSQVALKQLASSVVRNEGQLCISSCSQCDKQKA